MDPPRRRRTKAQRKQEPASMEEDELMSKPGTEAIPARRELPYLFEKELIENSRKHTFIFDCYGGQGSVPIAPKFYSRHEQKFLVKKGGPAGNTAVFSFVARDKYKRPVVESQKYGWIPDTDWNQFRHALPRTDITLFEERVASEKVTERPTFTGLKFNLK